MKNKLTIALAGLLAISTASFAADRADHGYRGGGDVHGGYHQEYRGDHAYRGDPGYVGGGGVYLGVTPGYAAPAPYAYSVPVAPYAEPYTAPYPDEYVGAPPSPRAIWIGGSWAFGPHGRYWVGGHWGRR